jgi:hypothetical protein
LPAVCSALATELLHAVLLDAVRLDQESRLQLLLRPREKPRTRADAQESYLMSADSVEDVLALMAQLCWANPLLAMDYWEDLNAGDERQPIAHLLMVRWLRWHVGSCSGVCGGRRGWVSSCRCAPFSSRASSVAQASSLQPACLRLYRVAVPVAVCRRLRSCVATVTSPQGPSGTGSRRCRWALRLTRVASPARLFASSSSVDLL